MFPAIIKIEDRFEVSNYNFFSFQFVPNMLLQLSSNSEVALCDRLLPDVQCW